MIRKPVYQLIAALAFALTSSGAWASPFECRPIELSPRHGKIERRIMKAFGDSLRARGLSDFTIKVTRIGAEPRAIVAPRTSFELRVDTEVSQETDAGARVAVAVGQGILRSDFLQTCTADGRYSVRIVLNPTTTGVPVARRTVIEKIVKILQPGKLMESRN